MEDNIVGKYFYNGGNDRLTKLELLGFYESLDNRIVCKEAL